MVHYVGDGPRLTHRLPMYNIWAYLWLLIPHLLLLTACLFYFLQALPAQSWFSRFWRRWIYWLYCIINYFLFFSPDRFINSIMRHKLMFSFWHLFFWWKAKSFTCTIRREGVATRLLSRIFLLSGAMGRLLKHTRLQPLRRIPLQPFCHHFFVITFLSE